MTDVEELIDFAQRKNSETTVRCRFELKKLNERCSLETKAIVPQQEEPLRLSRLILESHTPGQSE